MDPALPEGTGRIEVRGLTKHFGSFTAVDHLDLDVEPGRITGFLGPNGAGKTTTLRMLLGLVRASSGTATIDGRRYADIHNPLTVVGSALEATNFHPGRTGRNHLRVQAAAAGVPNQRVDELLELVGIAGRGAQAGRGLLHGHAPAARSGGGHARRPARPHPRRARERPRPRGDPLVARVPAPSGRRGPHAAHSSHMLSEVEQTVDDVVIIANGKRVAQGTVGELRGEPTAYVRTSDPERLTTALHERGLRVAPKGAGRR